MSDEPPTEDGRTDENNYVAVKQGVCGPGRGPWLPDPDNVAQLELQRLRQNRSLVPNPSPDHIPQFANAPHDYTELLNPPSMDRHIDGGELLRRATGLEESWACCYHHLANQDQELAFEEQVAEQVTGLYAVVHRDFRDPHWFIVVSAPLGNYTEHEIDRISLNVEAQPEIVYCFKEHPHIYHPSIGGLICLLGLQDNRGEAIRGTLKVPPLKDKFEGQPLSHFVFHGEPRHIDPETSRRIQTDHDKLLSG
eukprot:m.155762 g.155762  ORF g.155762 m.155762 type:complete len:251 (-) comp16283_c2_seq8:299-1051(-)